MGVSLEQRSDSLTTLKVDDTIPNICYVGEANIASSSSAPVWRIRKIDTTTGVDIKWADGNSNYDNVWDNRTLLSYN